MSTLSRVAAVAAVGLALPLWAGAPVWAAPAPSCQGTIYLTFDTGNQSQAELIAQMLAKHQVKATFFLANEKTARGNYSLDVSWGPYWKALVAQGHAFGSHTFDHAYWQRDAAHGLIQVKPQFGKDAGKKVYWPAQRFCEELRRVDQRFEVMTGTHLDPIWRAPGGKVSPRTLAVAKSCGYAHVGWAKAGFSGDELPSETYSNASLLQGALDNLKDGDIFMAHMGIWSRKDPWAPANLEPLIVGLQQKGFCFATLREHPGLVAAATRP